MTTERWVVVGDHGRELGTSYDVEVVVREGEEAAGRKGLAAALARCRELELSLSEWKDDSDISRLNQQAWSHPVPVTASVERLLAGALHVARATQGAFDFTWAPLGALWDQAEQRGSVPDEAELAEVRRYLGFDKVVLEAGTVRFLTPGTKLGVASFAKGWIIDDLFLVLRSAGFANAIVNIGGDLRVSGHDVNAQPQTFRVLNPYRPSLVAAEIAVAEGALATSGNYFRKRTIGGKDYGHLFDPATGRPPEFDGSVTVLCAEATMADALSTALFVMGPDRGLDFARRVPGLEVLYVTRKGFLATEGLLARARLGPVAELSPAMIFA